MPNIYLDYSLKCINSKPTKGKAPQLEGAFVRREFSLKIEHIEGFKQYKSIFCIFAKTYFQRIIIPITAMKRRVHFLRNVESMW